jgi:hypothetical protein
MSKETHQRPQSGEVLNRSFPITGHSEIGGIAFLLPTAAAYAPRAMLEIVALGFDVAHQASSFGGTRLPV